MAGCRLECEGGLVMRKRVVFAAVAFGLACLAAEWKPSRLLIAGGILVLALLVAAPWLILIVERHGITALLAASTSHRKR